MTWIEEWKKSNNEEWKNLLLVNKGRDVARLEHRVAMAREARLRVDDDSFWLGDGGVIRPEAKGERCIAVKTSVYHNGELDNEEVELFPSLESAKGSICEFLFDSGLGKDVEWVYFAHAYDLDTGRRLHYDTVQTIEWR